MTRKLWCQIIGGFLCAVPCTFAANTVTFNLTGVSGGVLSGVYTSPYYATITPTGGGPSISTSVICDDFADDTFIPETWTANVTDLSSLTTPSSTVYWSQGLDLSTGSVFGGSLNQAQAYTTAAYLAVELLASPIGSLQAGELSFAMWGLFDPNAFNALSGSNLTGARNALTSAENAVFSGNLTPSNYAGVTIYTPVLPSDATCGGGTCAHIPPQEFIAVAMPEPSTSALLTLNLAGIGIVALFFRRRALKA